MALRGAWPVALLTLLAACGDDSTPAPVAPSLPAPAPAPSLPIEPAAPRNPLVFEFASTVPEEIVFRKYPFIREVEFALEQRWFDDAKTFEHAVLAFDATLRHAERLQSDHVYRALDSARQQVDVDPDLSGCVYEAIFASPYLVCYTDGERIDEAAIAKLPLPARRARWAAIEAKKAGWRMTLAEKAKIFQQTYAEFMRRYAEPCDLKPLMDEYGGRPDYPVGKRSFRDGCPLVVWITSAKKVFSDWHEEHKDERIRSGLAGFVSGRTGRVFSYDEDNGDREFEVQKYVHQATQQLLHWFPRQRDEWAVAHIPADFFDAGLCEYVGAVTMDMARTLTFVGLNRPRLESLKQVKAMLSKQNQKMFAFPVKDLVGFEGYGNVVAWAAEHWGAFGAGAGLSLFYVQSWALVYFLNEFANHKYQPAFTRLVNDMVRHPREAEHYAFDKFKVEIGMQSEDDWKKLDKEFQTYYLGTLATMRLETIGPKPPARADWPGYVEPDLLDPRGPR